MEKLLSILVLAISLFFVACGLSDEALPSYDFSSDEAFENSIVAQGEKEGFSAKETQEIAESYIVAILFGDTNEIDEVVKNAKTEEEANSASKNFLQNHINGKTIKEMKEYIEKK